MATNIIQVKPLPSGTTVADVKNAFTAYSLKRVQVSSDKAYLEFNDANEIQTLQFAFDGLKVPALGDAEIDTVSEEFQWPQQQTQFLLQEKKPEVEEIKKVEESYPDITGQSIDKINQVVPKFIVIKECDSSHLKQCDQQFIRNQIFSKYNIGKIVKWQKDVFVEFLDSNQIQILENHFKDLFVLDLGPIAKIDGVDENFDIGLIEFAVQKHQQQQRLRKQQEQMQRLQEVEKKKRELEQIRKRHEEQEKLAKMKESEARSRLSEKSDGETVTYNKKIFGQKPQSAKSRPLKYLWLGIVITWGFYVILS